MAADIPSSATGLVVRFIGSASQLDFYRRHGFVLVDENVRSATYVIFQTGNESFHDRAPRVTKVTPRVNAEDDKLASAMLSNNAEERAWAAGLLDALNSGAPRSGTKMVFLTREDDARTRFCSIPQGDSVNFATNPSVPGYVLRGVLS